MAQTAYAGTKVPASRCPDARELRKLSEQLDTSRGTFLFAHARLAWLESHGEKELPQPADSLASQESPRTS